MLLDPRTSVIYDDARHYILTTPEKFDVITTDPIHPWVKGTSALYSREFYELVKDHLNPGGVAAQWLPLYQSDEDTVRTELATFFSVFPGATVWSNYLDGDGYDLVLLGRAEESPIDVDAIDRRLENARLCGRRPRRWPSQVSLRRGFARHLRRPGSGFAAHAHRRRDQ